MKVKVLLAQVGFPGWAGVKGYISAVFGGKKKRLLPLAREQERFQEEMKTQFLKLKEKGLSIAVFTL